MTHPLEKSPEKPKNKLKENAGKTPEDIWRAAGGAAARMHVFLCTGPDCVSAEQGEQAWQALKGAVKERCPELGAAAVYRTRVKCFRICRQGPIVVAYPWGRWFQQVTPGAMGPLLDHLLSGSGEPPVPEFAQNSLGCGEEG
ncbi:MAG: (2Fe-2S) ferredoxin domain-containing protein [Deltaproteobacteria bacterium]|nr:(2Fe-2S) ferredoxin domain-containing protein [Deltaproteobacteria bacterium]